MFRNGNVPTQHSETNKEIDWKIRAIKQYRNDFTARIPVIRFCSGSCDVRTFGTDSHEVHAMRCERSHTICEVHIFTKKGVRCENKFHYD
jgi:hypothetical protein